MSFCEFFYCPSTRSNIGKISQNVLLYFFVCKICRIWSLFCFTNRFFYLLWKFIKTFKKGGVRCRIGNLHSKKVELTTKSSKHFFFSTITDPKIPLKINVKDKDEPIGQIIFPLSDIPSEEHFLKWVPIGPHKKNSNPSGELCIDCWVEDFYDNDEEIVSQSSMTKKYFNKTLHRLKGRSPEPARKHKEITSAPMTTAKTATNIEDDNGNRRHSYATGVVSMKGSVSVEDLSGPNTKYFKPNFKNNLLAPAAYQNFSIRRTSSTAVLETAKKPANDQKRSSIGDISTLGQLAVIKEQCYPPKILSIVPSSGSSKGGTLIQITGKHLGVSRDDITRLMVAGCNCLPTLEYYTCNKIMCTTSNSEGVGPVSISTKSGGMSSSKMMYEFVDIKSKAEEDRDETDGAGTDFLR